MARKGGVAAASRILTVGVRSPDPATTGAGGAPRGKRRRPAPSRIPRRPFANGRRGIRLGAGLRRFPRGAPPAPVVAGSGLLTPTVRIRLAAATPPLRAIQARADQGGTRCT